MIDSIFKTKSIFDLPEGTSRYPSPCGCVEEVHRKGRMAWSVPFNTCEQHKNERAENQRQQEIENEKKMWRDLARSEELKCDKCGAHIGWIDAFDIEGTKFFCDECKNPSM